MKCLLTVICSLVLGTQAMSAPQAVLLGPDLEPVSVQLKSISPEVIKVIDAVGQEKELKPEEVLRLTLASDTGTTPSPAQTRVVLRDGQVIVGDWAGGGGDGESISVSFGDTEQMVMLPLDEIMSIAMRSKAAVPAVDEDDVLLLANGEKLTGFLEWMGAEALDFVVGDADDPIKIPLERVAAVAVANKPKAAEAKPGTLRVTRIDGTVLLMQDATLTDRDDGGSDLSGLSALSIEPKVGVNPGASIDSPSPVRFPMSDVVGIEPLSKKTRLVSLSGRSLSVLDGGEVFGVAMKPSVTGDGAIKLHAPVKLGFDLPKGASRLAFTVEMDLDARVPDARRSMAGCELIVYSGDTAVAKHTLTPDGPPKRINVPLASGDLRIALEPGINGPVLDRVILTQAELLVSE